MVKSPPYLVHELAPFVDASQRRSYAARVLGTWNDDGLWDGYIEFTSEGGRVVMTPRETRQANVAALVYWSTGLTPAYLQGALERAREATARARRNATRLTPRRRSTARASRVRAAAPRSSRPARGAGARASHR